jgi:hypothetical protein
MRLTFPNGEHESTQFDQGEILVGSDPACAVALKGEGLRAMHAVLSLDARGLVLSVLGNSGAATLVNGREIRELAILRAGDELALGPIQCCVQSGDGPRELPPATSPSNVAVSGTYPRVIVRGLSGDWLGRFARLRETLSFGSDADCDIDLPPQCAAAIHSALELGLEGIFLRAAAAGNRVEVNGYECENAVLKPNDQLKIGGERFLIEAPGYRPVSVTPIPEPSASTTGVMRRIEVDAPPPLEAGSDPATTSTKPTSDFISEMPDWLWFTLIGLIAVAAGVLVWYVRS